MATQGNPRVHPRPRRRSRWRALLVALVGLVLLGQSCRVAAWARARASRDDELVSMPPSGDGFETYSFAGAALGRQYVRADVKDALIASFARMADEETGRVFVVAETGNVRGDRFFPHATHREGRAVDVLVPLSDEDGAPAALDTSFWNLWGYCWRLDDDGRVAGLAWEGTKPVLPVVGKLSPCPEAAWTRPLALDVEALARWLVILDEEARARGARVARVIVAPEHEDAIEDALGTGWWWRTKTRAWVRHDEHVHVEIETDR